MKKAVPCASLGVLAVVLASQPAMAQQTPVENIDSGEILVTAQRRSERARDVPISLTALSGNELKAAGIKDTLALTMVTPGLKMDRVGNFTLPSLRGVTTTITGPGADANVAIYLDGIYQPSSTGNTFDLPDVERIEVLKGPQGTLFGRNATGGAIQVFTRMPDDDVAGSISASYGSFNTVSAKGFVSVPIETGVAAVSIAGSIEKGDSYYHNLLNGGEHPEGINSKLLRGKLRLTPTDNLSILLTAMWSDRSDPTSLNGSSVARLLVAPPASTATVPSQPYEYASNGVPFQRSTSEAYSAKIELDVAGGTLSSLTGLSRYKNRSFLDADYAATSTGLSVDYLANSTDRAFSQEVSFASKNDGRFNYSVGAFYYDGWGGWTPLGIVAPGFLGNIWSRQNIESAAAFGELYFDVTDRLSVIAGGRYSWERRDFESTFDFSLVDNPPKTYFAGPRSANNFSPRASLRYKLTPSSNVYFTFSQGFKSGLFDPTAYQNLPTGEPSTAKAEKLSAYELGYKGRVTDWLSLNAAAFYYDYKDIQVTFYQSYTILDANNQPVSLSLSSLGNAQSARIWGAEFDANARFGNFEMRAGVSILDPKYKRFDATVQTPNLGMDGLPNLTGNHDAPRVVDGQQMIKAAKFTGYLTGTYHAPVAGGTLDLSGTVYHSSRIFYTYDQRIVQNGYETFDARIAWSPENKRYTLSVYGRNLSDKAVIAGTFVTAHADGISWQPPRTFGVQLDYHF